MVLHGVPENLDGLKAPTAVNLIKESLWKHLAFTV